MTENCGHHHNCLEQLRADHEEILLQLENLERAVAGQNFDKKQIGDFLHFTETFAEPHHEKEEKVLFPELEQKGIPNEGGPIGVMLSEHAAKRGYVKNLKIALENNDIGQMKENSLAIVGLLRDHINKENNILYPMAEQVLTEEDLCKISDQCEHLHEK